MVDKKHAILKISLNKRGFYKNVKVETKKGEKIFTSGNLVKDYINAYNFISMLLDKNKILNVYHDIDFDKILKYNPEYEYIEIQDGIFCFNYSYKKYNLEVKL